MKTLAKWIALIALFLFVPPLGFFVWFCWFAPRED